MKKPNIKALAIDHGEKIAFGAFALISLGVLATTNWSRFARTPDELKQNVVKVRDKIKSPTNVWPAAEKEKYKVVDFSERSKLFFTPLASVVADRFEFSTPIFHPLYRKDEPRREPALEAVQLLIAKAGWAPLSIDTSLPLSEEESEGTTTPESEMPATEGGEFESRPTNQAGNGNMALAPAGAGFPPTNSGRGGPPGGAHGGRGGAPGAGHNARPPVASASHSGRGGAGSAHSGRGGAGAAHGGRGGAGGAPTAVFDGMPGGSMSSYSMGGMGGTTKAKGVRYIAVRGVFPLRKQIDDYKRALHISDSEASSLVEIADFVLERQVATDGADPWKDGEWKQVSLSTAEEILEECSDLDPTDPVPIAMQDPVITMGLPLRLLFTWGEAATHPKIKDAELSAEQAEAESKLLEGVDETLNSLQMGDDGKTKRRGLAKVQRDVKSAVGAVRSSPDAMKMMGSMYAAMPKGAPGMGGAMAGRGPGPGAGMGHNMPRPPTGAPGAMGAMQPGMNMQMQMQMGMGMGMGMGAGGGMGFGGSPLDRLLSSQYLLFRYLDFDVEPGKAYRYRVRLALRNPNFDLTPEELGSADAEITKGEERETPWSNISNPEVVPPTVDYFLKQIERQPYAEEKVKVNNSKAVAQMSMFNWDTKFGTVVTDNIKIPTIGGFLSEEKKEILVLDLAEGILEKEKSYNLGTLDLLVDVDPDPDVEADKHPDLKFTDTDKHGIAHVGVVPVALIATESGNLKPIDTISEKSDELRWQNRLKHERDGYKEGEAKSDNRLTMFGNQEDEADNEDGKKKKKKRSSRLAKPGAAGGPAAAASAAARMMQMMPGMGQPPAPGGTSKKKSGR